MHNCANVISGELQSKAESEVTTNICSSLSLGLGHRRIDTACPLLKPPALNPSLFRAAVYLRWSCCLPPVGLFTSLPSVLVRVCCLPPVFGCLVGVSRALFLKNISSSCIYQKFVVPLHPNFIMTMNKLSVIAFALLALLACNTKNEPAQSGSSSGSGTDTPAPTTVDGQLFGLFSVSPTKKVHFSQGNLQYQDSTNTWRFAENQYDLVSRDNRYFVDVIPGWQDIPTAGVPETIRPSNPKSRAITRHSLIGAPIPSRTAETNPIFGAPLPMRNGNTCLKDARKQKTSLRQPLIFTT